MQSNQSTTAFSATIGIDRLFIAKVLCYTLTQYCHCIIIVCTYIHNYEGTHTFLYACYDKDIAIDRQVQYAIQALGGSLMQ